MLCFSGEFTENNHKVAQHKESTGREDKDERTIALPDIQAEDGATAQHLAHHTDKCQRQRKAQACTKAIESRLQGINAGIRTLSGITFLSNEITMLDITSTNIVATPIPKPLAAEVVVAKVGHIPNTNTKVGLFLSMPSVKNFKFLPIYNTSLFVSPYNSIFLKVLTALSTAST